MQPSRKYFHFPHFEFGGSSFKPSLKIRFPITWLHSGISAHRCTAAKYAACRSQS